MSSQSILTVTIERRNGVALISFEGAIDLASARQLDEALAGVDPHVTIGILLDVGLLTFIDSTGLHWIDRARQRAERYGSILAVVNCTPDTERAFQVAGMGHVLQPQAARDLLERFSAVGGIGDALPPARGDDHA